MLKYVGGFVVVVAGVFTGLYLYEQFTIARAREALRATVSPAHAASVPPANNVSEEKPTWSFIDLNDPLTSKSGIAARLEATGGASSHGKVTMTVRCLNNATELYINWNDYLGLDSTKVNYRVGAGTAKSASWSLSTDNKSTFAPAPIPLLRAMASEKEFVARVTPYNENPVTAVFDITGADGVVDRVRTMCGWDKVAKMEDQCPYIGDNCK
jgi:type VI secretion system protein VasI